MSVEIVRSNQEPKTEAVKPIELDKYGTLNYNLTPSGLRLFKVTHGAINVLTFISEFHPAYLFEFKDMEVSAFEIERLVNQDYLKWADENSAALEKYVY